MARFSRAMRVFGAGVLLTSALAGSVAGQGFDLRSLFMPGQATPPPAPPAPEKPAMPPAGRRNGAANPDPPGIR